MYITELKILETFVGSGKDFEKNDSPVVRNLICPGRFDNISKI